MMLWEPLKQITNLVICKSDFRPGLILLLLMKAMTTATQLY